MNDLNNLEQVSNEIAVLIRPRKGELERIIVRMAPGQTPEDLEEEYDAHFEQSFAGRAEAEAYKPELHDQELILL